MRFDQTIYFFSAEVKETGRQHTKKWQYFHSQKLLHWKFKRLKKTNFKDHGIYLDMNE